MKKKKERESRAETDASHPGEYFTRLAEIEFAENFAGERSTSNGRNVDSFRRRDVARTNQRVLISLRPNYTERMQSKSGIATPNPIPHPLSGGFFIIRGH